MTEGFAPELARFLQSVGMVDAMAAPLRNFRLFETSDASEARAQVSRVFSPHRLDVAPHQLFRAVHNRVDLGGCTLNYLHYGADVGIEVEHLGPFYLLQISLHGGARFESRGEMVDLSTASAALLCPAAGLKMDWSGDARHLIFQMPGEAVRSVLEALLGRRITKPLTFDLDFRIDGPRTRILKLIQLLQDDLDSGCGVMTSGIAGAQIREAIIVSMLKCQPHTYSAALSGPPAAVAPRQVRRAEDFMRHNLGRPITLAEIAEASGGSIRSLHEGFRRFRDTTPLERLRLFRLEGAHRDLGAPRPDDTVTAIALRWGFSHLSRFSIGYRERYGRLPSETLRRGVG